MILSNLATAIRPISVGPRLIKDVLSPLNNVITIADERIRSHLERVVRGTVEETLNARMLRGLKGVRLITSDACIGLAESAAEFFPEAAWQRCVVHWYRNIFSHVPSTKVREIAAMLKAIHASEDIAAAREKAIRVIEKLRGLRLARPAELVEAAI